MHITMCCSINIGLLHFTNLDLYQLVYFDPPQYQTKDEAEFSEFWGYVKFWCTEVLCNNYYQLEWGGMNCGGGIGLITKINCTGHILVRNIVGLLENCTVSQSDMFRSFHYHSLYESVRSTASNVVQVMYGPASLTNNCNNSIFTFMDRRWGNNHNVTGRGGGG